MLDLSSNYFALHETDRYVDFFFTDNKDEPLIQSNLNEENLFEDKLFPSSGIIKNNSKAKTYSSNEQEKKLQTKKKMKNTYASKIAKLIHQEAEADGNEEAS